MKITLELNRKFGHGYQVHMVHGPVDSVFDEEPLSITDAGGHVAWMVEEMNKTLGSNFKPHEVLSVEHEALVANKEDFVSRRLLKDIETGSYDLTKPPEQVDYRIDENGETLLSERGILLFAYTSWFDEGKKDDKGKQFLRSYCRLLAFKGYGGGAESIFSTLQGIDVKDGIAWCKKTYAKYVSDGEMMRLLNSLKEGSR